MPSSPFAQIPITLTDKIPPQNLEAEASVLGALLIDKDTVIKIADILRPDDFYKNANGFIFEVILELFERHQPIDILAVANRLEEKGSLSTIGGRAYLASLANAVPTAAHIVSYAEIVHRKATLRRLIGAASEITALGFGAEDEEINKIIDEAEQKLFNVSQISLQNKFIPIQNVLTEAFDRIDELHKQSGKLRGVPTGYQDIDKLLAGLQNSDLIILAARPSIGKTSLAMDIARQVAVKEKIPVGIFSLEMSKEQLVDRLLCAEAGVDLWKMRTGHLAEREEDDDFARIGNAMAQLAEAPLYIDDSPMATIMDIRTKARRLKMEHGLGLIVLDYLQLITGTSRKSAENRVQEISEITRALKAIARELNVPLLALSQLSRAVEARTPPIPKLADLRDSGSIEQDADVVMFIYREEYYRKETARRHIADILISKHRNGPTGQAELYFDERRVSFKNLEKRLGEMPTPSF